MEPDYTTI